MSLKSFYGKVGAGLIRAYIKVIYCPTCVDKPEFDGAVIYISNHTSHLDGMAMLTALTREKPYALTAKDWFDKKLLGPVFTAARGIPLNRFGIDTSWLRTASEKIKEGSSVIVFPEGHTVRGEGLGEFKPGFVMLSKMTGAKIVPSWHGEYRAFRKNYIYFDSPRDSACRAMTADALSSEGARFRDIVSSLGKRESL